MCDDTGNRAEVACAEELPREEVTHLHAVGELQPADPLPPGPTQVSVRQHWTFPIRSEQLSPVAVLHSKARAAAELCARPLISWKPRSSSSHRASS